jgi:S-adenosylmethionine-diacylglycerol 3-amino-3-carboxypropyl transferase
VPDEVLGAWHYGDELSRELTRQDRSSIYGAFHLYTLKGA